MKLYMLQTKCATNIMKNKIYKDSSSLLKLFDKESGQHVVSFDVKQKIIVILLSPYDEIGASFYCQ